MSDDHFRNVSVIKKDEKGVGKQATKMVMFEDIDDDHFLSILTKSKTSGPNLNLAKGPKDDLLLWVCVFMMNRQNDE